MRNGDVLKLPAASEGVVVADPFGGYWAFVKRDPGDTPWSPKMANCQFLEAQHFMEFSRLGNVAPNWEAPCHRRLRLASPPIYFVIAVAI